MANEKVKGRYIDQFQNSYSGNLDVYGYVLRADGCAGTHFMSRYASYFPDIRQIGGVILDPMINLDVYAFTVDCDGKVFDEFVRPECNPTQGVSTILRLKWNGFPPECYPIACPESFLVYDSSVQRWKGVLGLSQGTLYIELFCDIVLIDPIFDIYGPKWGISVWGCPNVPPQPPDTSAEVGVLCARPLSMATGPLTLGIFPECCQPYERILQVTATIKGFGVPIQTARYVNVAGGVNTSGTEIADGTPVYAFSEICLDDSACTFESPCCPGIQLNTSLTVTFIPVSGACGCIGGSITVTRLPGEQYWLGTLSGCNQPSKGYTNVRVQCVPAGSGNYAWSVVGEGPPFCGFGTNSFDEGYTCDPLLVDMDPTPFFGCCEGMVKIIITD